MAAKGRRLLWVLLAASTVATGALFWLRSDVSPTTHTGAPSLATHSLQTATPPVDAAAVAGDVAHPPSAERQQDAAVASVLNQYLCQEADKACGDNPFAATSPQEAAWLRAAGFPTPGEISAAKSMSTAQLEQQAKPNNRIAESLYGERLVAEGNMETALGVLGMSANRGNIYALYQLSRMYGDDRNRFKNPLLSKAYLRLAYVAGDYKVSDTLANTFPDFNSPSDYAYVDKRAAELHRNLLGGRVAPRPAGQ